MSAALRLRYAMGTIEWPRVGVRELLAVLTLASLFVRSQRFPVVAEFGSAQVRLQDLLFGAVIAAGAPTLLRWARRHPFVAASLAGFTAMLFVSALRSPLGAPALVAVGKFALFVLAGAAAGLLLQLGRNPALVTGALVAGTAVNAAAGLGRLLAGGGPAAILTGRGEGLVGTETVAAGAGITLIWCLVRIGRVAGPLEMWLCRLGVLVALGAFLAAKSVLVLGVAGGLVLLVPVLGSPATLRRAAVAFGLIAIALLVGRASDIAALVGGDEDDGPAPAAVRPAGIPENAKVAIPLSYERRAPTGLSGGSFVHRIALTYLGVELARDAPLFGFGWQATSDREFLRDRPTDLAMLERFPRMHPSLLVSVSPTAMHNAYLQVAAEAGVFALLLLLILLGAALLPAMGVAAVQRRSTPWPVACGIGWLGLFVVFLTSSTLYGGQLETAALGAALTLAAPLGGHRHARRIPWLKAGASVALLVAAFACLIVLPAGDAPSPPAFRATLEGPAGEVFAVGERFAEPDEALLDNGLVSARAAADGRIRVDVAPRVAGRPATIAIATGGDVDSARVVQRSAAQVRTAYYENGRVAFTMAVVRGVPGVFVTPAGLRRTVTVDADDAVAIASARASVGGLPPFPRLPVKLEPAEVAVTLDDALTAVTPLGPATAVRRGRRLEVRATGGPSETRTVFVGGLPRAGLADAGLEVGVPAETGSYLVALPPDGQAALRQVTASRRPPWTGSPAVVVPYAVDRPHAPGVAELASLAFFSRYEAAVLPGRETASS